MKRFKPRSAATLRNAAKAHVQRAGTDPDQSHGDLLRIQHELRVHKIELEMQNEELRKAHAEIEAGLERFTNLYDFAPSGLFNLDRKGVIRLVNLAGANLVGLPRAELTGRRFGIFLSPASRKAFANIQQEVLASGEPKSFESVLQPEELPPRFVQLAASRSPDGTECRLVAIDITEAKQARQALELRDRALAGVSQGVIIADENRIIIYANTGFVGLTGYPVEEVVGRNCSILQGPKSSQTTIGEIRAAVRAHQIFQGEILNYRKDGTTFWNDLLISPIVDPDGGPVRFLGVQRDITDRKMTATLLAESERRLALATESAHIGIWEWDVSGDAIICNERMFELYGMSDADGIGSHNEWLKTLHLEDRPRMEADVMAAINHGGEYRTQFRVVLPDGKVRHLRSHGAVQRRDDSTRVIGVTWDVTAECEREERTAAALVHEKQLSREARAGEHAKGEFLAVMSHEVRTPVSGILGFAELLANAEGLPPDLQTYARIILQSSESLLRILDDILNFSRLDAGNVELETTPFAPRTLLRDISNLFRPQINNKKLELVVNVAADVPEILTGDAGRLRQILLNLVGNAVKFTEQGRITISLEAPSSPSESFAFAVQDTGPGIPPENLKKIFHPFTQADSSISRRHAGTGLGLTISRRLTAILGGTLTVTSQLGEGTRFTASIPFGAASASRAITPTRPALALDASFASTHPLTILLAEDDCINLKLACILVRRLGYEPLTAKNGIEAVALAALHQPGCILMDLQMPEMDGIEATRAIRERKYTSPIFIAALTADIFPADRERCLTAGMDEFLNKPIRLANLADVFAKASKQKANSRLSL